MINDVDVINRLITEHSTDNNGRKQFIDTIISEWKQSDRLKLMFTSQRYYENRNEEIDKSKRVVIGRGQDNNPIQMESFLLANNKLYHPFIKKLVKQKLAYLLGKPFTFSSIKAEDETANVMFSEVNDMLGKLFHRKLINTCRDAIVKTLGWMQVFYDEEGSLQFKRVPPEEVIPLWKDSDHTVLDAVIRYYGIDIYEGGKKTTKYYVEMYDLTGVYFYTYTDGGKLEVDTTRGVNGVAGHFQNKTINPETGKEEVVYANWARIPWIPFKYDADEDCILNRVKSLIDNYDKMTSNNANAVEDFPNAITVVKNYDGSNKEEFVHNKNMYRTIFVQGEGDAKSLETPLDIENVDKHIERLRQDIYEFGQGVDTQNKDIRDTSGVALRFLYADLDLDCVGWSIEEEASITQLVWFVLVDIKNRTGKDYMDVRYNIIFNRDMIVNETETITNCQTSVGIVSDETVIANHPWTKEVKKEIENIVADKKRDMELENSFVDNYGTGESGTGGEEATND